MLVGAAAVPLGVVFYAAAHAQSPSKPPTIKELPCIFCHTCENPTVRYPCLRRSACPRRALGAIEKEPERQGGPDRVILDRLAELYLPVPFDHQGHSEMADMMGGCAICHHHTPEGVAHPPCETCHEISPEAEDVRKPGLKVAYHRQCVSCHREWSGATSCTACHLPRVGQDPDASTAEGLPGGMHPPIPKPHTEIYESKSTPNPGTKIVFRHKEHIDRFGLRCADCHREDTCSRCHGEREDAEQSDRTRTEHHAPCSRCHDVENKAACDHCHWNEGEAKPKPFEHATTGWALNRFHLALACRTCHKDVPFRRLDRNCSACHSSWSPSSFDHAVTGQLLDRDHEESACADCHTERKFDSPPRCDGCHEEDEEVTFPAKRPGPVVIPSHRGNDPPSGG